MLRHAAACIGFGIAMAGLVGAIDALARAIMSV